MKGGSAACPAADVRGGGTGRLPSHGLQNVQGLPTQRMRVREFIAGEARIANLSKQCLLREGHAEVQGADQTGSRSKT